jgi:hypothetical protein
VKRTSRKEAVAALQAIVDLDFAKDDRGRDDLYSGPSRFVRAWLIAHDALSPIPARDLAALCDQAEGK